MPAMIRKQFYIEPRQDKLLKRLAKKNGTTEAELVRKAIDQYAGEMDARQKRIAAWEKEMEFAREWREHGPEPETWKWNREELYDRDYPGGH